MYILMEYKMSYKKVIALADKFLMKLEAAYDEKTRPGKGYGDFEPPAFVKEMDPLITHPKTMPDPRDTDPNKEILPAEKTMPANTNFSQMITGPGYSSREEQQFDNYIYSILKNINAAFEADSLILNKGDIYTDTPPKTMEEADKNIAIIKFQMISHKISAMEQASAKKTSTGYDLAKNLIAYVSENYKRLAKTDQEIYDIFRKAERSAPIGFTTLFAAYKDLYFNPDLVQQYPSLIKQFMPPSNLRKPWESLQRKSQARLKLLSRAMRQ
jgi:hypothetical protein